VEAACSEGYNSTTGIIDYFKGSLYKMVSRSDYGTFQLASFMMGPVNYSLDARKRIHPPREPMPKIGHWYYFLTSIGGYVWITWKILGNK